MSDVELARQRDITGLFRDGLAVYARNLRVFLTLSAAIVVPVHVVVSGIGLEQLSAGYDRTPSAAAIAAPTAVSFLVVAPLIAGTCIRALQELGGGGRPKARVALVEGLEAFTPLFPAVLLAAAGIALGLALLIVPGIYLAIRWFFVPQAVVIDRARGAGALRHSGEAVEGFWWRTLVIVLAANLLAALPGFLLAEVVTAPFIAIIATLLYYDLRARRRAGPGLA